MANKKENIFLKGWSFKKKKNEKNSPKETYVRDIDKDAPYVFEDMAFKNSNSFFNFSNIDTRNALELISIYRKLAKHHVIDSAIEEIISEILGSDEDESTLDLVFNEDFEDVDIPNTLETAILNEFRTVLKLLNFKKDGYDILRSAYIDGKYAVYHQIDPNNSKKGIQRIVNLDSRCVHKVNTHEIDTDENGGKVILNRETFYIYKTDGITNTKKNWGLEAQKLENTFLFTDDSVSYLTSGLTDDNNENVISYLHKALRPYHLLKLLEDSAVIYRYARAPERRYIFVGTKGLGKKKAESFLADIMNSMKSETNYNSTTGSVDSNSDIMTFQEDIVIPRPDGSNSSDIEFNNGGANGFGEIEDIELFTKNLYKALHVPVSRLESSEGFSMGRSSEITRDELKFTRFLNRLRTRYAAFILDILKKQCLLKGILTKDEWEDIEDAIFIRFNGDNHFTELKEMELLSEKIDLIGNMSEYTIKGDLGGKFFTEEEILKNILMLSDNAIEKLKKYKEEAPEDDDDSSGGRRRR